MHALLLTFVLERGPLADGAASVPLSTLLFPLVGLIGGALVAAVGNVVVARIQARASSSPTGAAVLVTVDKAWLDDLVDSERMLGQIVATRLPQVDPLTGLDR